MVSLNLWRPPSVALYAKVLHVLGTDRKAVVESLFWEIMLTVSHLEEPGYGTNCHCQEEPPTLSPLVGSVGAARFLLVQAPTPALASATTRVGCPRPFAADAARAHLMRSYLPPRLDLVLRWTKFSAQLDLVPDAR